MAKSKKKPDYRSHFKDGNSNKITANGRVVDREDIKAGIESLFGEMERSYAREEEAVYRRGMKRRKRQRPGELMRILTDAYGAKNPAMRGEKTKSGF